jgi:hypothetical protein
MNKFFRLPAVTLFCCAATCFLSGCDKDVPVSEEKILAYYEINRDACLNWFTMSESDMLELRKVPFNSIFTMVHISDAHLSSWSSNNRYENPSNLTEAVRFVNDPEVKIHVMVDTGDHIGNAPTTTREKAALFMNEYAKALYDYNQVPTFTSTGNHDANLLNREHQEYALTRSDLHALVTSKTNYPVHSPEACNYYYADVTNPTGGKIRIISLDVIDQKGTAYDVQHFATFSQEQIDWFCHTALKEGMTGEHQVIVLVHFPLSTTHPGLRAFTGDEYTYSWKMIPEIIEAFRSKNEWVQTYKNRFDSSDILTVNVSFKDSPGDFICYLGGHIHTYLHYEVDDFRNLNPALPRQLMIIANNMSPSDKNSKSPIERNTEGLLNNTFNIYAIDTRSRTVYVSFFGATAYYYSDILLSNQAIVLKY